MLDRPIEDPERIGPDDLLEGYAAALAAAVEAVGRDRLLERSAVDGADLEAIAAGDVGALGLETAATVLGADPDRAPADAVLSAARDHLMLSMSSAMLDVDRLAADLGGDLDPGEVQAKLEGRLSMSLEEFARIKLRLASRSLA